jgi:hypothetical protein
MNYNIMAGRGIKGRYCDLSPDPFPWGLMKGRGEIFKRG